MIEMASGQRKASVTALLLPQSLLSGSMSDSLVSIADNLMLMRTSILMVWFAMEILAMVIPNGLLEIAIGLWLLVRGMRPYKIES